MSASPTPRTRDELLALGKTDASWTYLSFAAAALHQAPADHAIRWLVALHLAKLGLGQASLDQLALLPPHVSELPEVQMTQRLAMAVGQGSVQSQALLLRVPSVLQALPDELAKLLTPAVPALRALLATHEVMLPRHVTQNQQPTTQQGVDVRGCIIRPKASTDLLTWTGGFDAIETAKEWAKTRAGKGSQQGVVVFGLCPPQPAYAVASMSAQHGGTQQAGVAVGKITIVEPDIARALLGIVLLEDRAPFALPHVRLVVGEGAIDVALRQLEATCERGDRLPTNLLSLPRSDITPLAKSLAQRVQALHDRQDARTRELVARVERRARARDEHWQRERWHEALREHTPAPLRVLLVTTRYSTFVKHSTSDLADSFAQLGCDTRVLIEAEAGDQLTQLSYVSAIDDHDPDLVVMVNYARAHVETLLPSTLPVLTLVQDALPNLLNADNAAKQGPLDVLAGVRMPELVRSFGYASERALPSPVPVSPRKFFRSAPSPTRFDIACITHHSAPPEVLHAEILAQQSIASARDAMQALYPVCLEVARTQPFGMKHQLRTAVASELAPGMRVSRAEVPEAATSQFVHGYCMRIIDRVLRHDMLAWAIDIARRHELRLALVGNGWHEHEAFARYAVPAVEHGPTLRELYASSACCLHASVHGVLHQRVFECAMSGGLPLCRNTINAAWPVFVHARAMVAQALAGTPTTMLTSDVVGSGMGWKASLHAWPLLRDATELVTRLGVPREAIVDRDGCCNVLASHAHERDVDEVASGIIVPASETFFANASELETLVLRAKQDDTWRTRTSEAISQACETSVTTDALVARVLASMQSLVAARGLEPLLPA